MARLDPVKQLDVFLRALPLLEDVRAVIVNYGPEQRHLETLARQLGIKERVCFTGYQKDVRPWPAALYCWTKRGYASHQKNGSPRLNG